MSRILRIHPDSRYAKLLYTAISRSMATTACPHAQQHDPGRKLLVFLACDLVCCFECLPAFTEQLEQTQAAITSGTDMLCDVCREEAEKFRPFAVQIGIATVMGDACGKCWNDK